ncbi:MAG: TIGR01459 family HAD-type hydrolase [Acetobacteraceae bacterium]|nr:TIGR01459 family HAD-type hydrolase [Acetobacteraceae bacterium]
MRFLTGFSEIASGYDGFVLDLWGVIHDGVNAFPHAVDCLTHLRDAGKRTLLLSNVPRPNDAVRTMMRGMGIADELYTGILTSGEAVRRSLQSPPDAWWAALGERVYHLGPERDRPVLAGLKLITVDTPAEADFVLNTGPDDHRNPSDINEFEPTLQECAKHRLPMICGNPDLEVIRGGVRVLCAGSLAVRYQALGGDVRSLGKPDPAIYQPVLAQLALPKHRVLAVGDSLRTDIAGAISAGLEVCWVLDGLHGQALRRADGTYDQRRVNEEAKAHGLAPVAAMARFAW